jgi:hypothetical protein
MQARVIAVAKKPSLESMHRLPADQAHTLVPGKVYDWHSSGLCPRKKTCSTWDILHLPVLSEVLSM